MSEVPSEALVFFGAVGDLAYKKIFPSLPAMVKRGHLNNVPAPGGGDVCRRGGTGRGPDGAVASSLP